MIDVSTTPRLALATRVAIEDLIIEHAWLIDHGRANELPDLYTEDGRMLGLGGDIVGRAAITAWSERRAAMQERTSRHAYSNLRLVPETDDCVRGSMIVTVYRRDGVTVGPATPLMVGDYEDVYERGDDNRWRFAERKLVTLFGG